MRRRGPLHQGGAMDWQTAAFPPTCRPWCGNDGVRPVRFSLSSRVCRGIWVRGGDVGARRTWAPPRSLTAVRNDPRMASAGQASTFLLQSGSEWVQGAPIEHVREIGRLRQRWPMAPCTSILARSMGSSGMEAPVTMAQWPRMPGRRRWTTSAGICAAPSTSSGA